MSRNIFSSGFNLPPGCTTRDIDRAAGVLWTCESCGIEFYPTDAQEEAAEEDKLDERLCKHCRKSMTEET